MTEAIQVDQNHYLSGSYMTSSRWYSIWVQLNWLMSLGSGRILEVGPGIGVLRAVGRLYGLNIETIDIDPTLRSDHIGSIKSLPFEDKCFDAVCAFQVLEHMEYSESLQAIKELCRVSSGHVLISLPNAQVVWRYRTYVPKYGTVDLMFKRPFWKPHRHNFDGEHYWELNTLGHELNAVRNDIEQICMVEKSWRPWENPYHHFFQLRPA